MTQSTPKMHNRLTRMLILFPVVLISMVFAGEAAAIPLSEALRTALDLNPSLSAAIYQREAAKSKIDEARSGYYPRLSLIAGYTAHEEPHIVVPIHEAGVFPPLDDQIYETGIQLKMPLYNGGRTSAGARAAAASFHESRSREDLVKFSLMEGIGNIFIQARQLNDHQQLITARIDSLDQRHRELSRLLNEGRVSPGDLALISASVASARADSVEVESRKMELAYRLAQLLGSETPVAPTITDINMETRKDGKEEPSLPSIAGADIAGPIVTTARARLTNAEASKEMADSNFFPEISAWGTYLYRSGSDLDMIGEWATGIMVQFPLFAGGGHTAARKAASASMRAAEKGVKSARQEQETRLQIAMEQWRSARLRRQYIEHAAAEKETSVAAHQELYHAGRIPLSDLLMQETELLQLRMTKKELLSGEMTAFLHYHGTAGTLTIEKVEKVAGSLP